MNAATFELWLEQQQLWAKNTTKTSFGKVKNGFLQSYKGIIYTETTEQSYVSVLAGY